MEEQLSFPIKDIQFEKSKKEKQEEIERKFLIDSLPEEIKEELKKSSPEEIRQGYIALEEDGVEVRIRQKGDNFYQTIKSGEKGQRKEIEIEITQDQFEKLWETTQGKRIEKTRYYLPYGNHTIELDFYKGDNEGLILAEVEFSSQEARESFTPPGWFGREVTEDENYYSRNLAIKSKKEKTKQKEIPEYNLEEGINCVVKLAREKMSEKQGPIIIEVAGGSASGKTSAVAAKLKEIFGGEAIIISMDDYYRGKTFMEQEEKKGNILNWDQPEAINLPLLKEHLQMLKEGKPIEKPIYDFKISEPKGTEHLEPRKIIILEGLFSLNDEIKDEGDIRVFVDIGTHGRILRRLLRDIERTGQRPGDILKYFSEIVEPMHEKYVLSTKENADLIIQNEYSPKVEAERSGFHEVQLKFRAEEIDSEKLRKAGAERLGSTQQIDNYYNPKDRNLVETEEILRIREEGDKIILTYKGPKSVSEFRRRPKFEFEIDKDTENKFLSIYGGKVKTIIKKRELYQLNGIIFSLDEVYKQEEGEKEELGKFIEIRSSGEKIDGKQFEEFLAKLGLRKEDGIKQSYFEM